MSFSTQRPTKIFWSIIVVITAVVTRKLTERLAQRTKERNERVLQLSKELAERIRGKVLDLRDEESFAKERIRGSYNIPQDSLWKDSRWYELPEQHEPLLVLLPPTNAECHAGIAKGFCDRRASGATSFLVANTDLFLAAQELDLLETGPPSKEGPDSSWKPLFTPSPFLTLAVALLEPQLRHASLPLTCIDIGCGAGRDVVWLAKRGWTVAALDCWHQALQKTAALAQRMCVAERVEVRKGKVNKDGDLIVSEGAPLILANDSKQQEPMHGDENSGALGSGASTEACGKEKERVIGPSTPASEFASYGLVVAIRFLERKAFDTLARLVDPRGGYLLLSTFIEEEHPYEQRRFRDSKPAVPTPFAAAATAPATSKVRHSERELTSNSANYLQASGSVSYSMRNASGDTSFGAEETAPGTAASEVVSEDGSGKASREEHEASVSEVRGKSEVGPVVDGRALKRPSLKRRALAAAAAAAETAAIMSRWPHETPKDASKILRRGELARVFGGRHGFEILEDTIQRLPDGRPIACFLARKLPLLMSSPSSTASSVTSRNRRSGWRFSQGHDDGNGYSPAKGFPNFPAEAVARLMAEVATEVGTEGTE